MMYGINRISAAAACSAPSRVADCADGANSRVKKYPSEEQDECELRGDSAS
jgi:hypothetical protein